MKYVLLLLIGMAIGYGYGFKDAKKHEKTVFSRTIDKIGGSNRGKYKTDTDKQMKDVER